jgi:hypothetical protein
MAMPAAPFMRMRGWGWDVAASGEARSGHVLAPRVHVTARAGSHELGGSRLFLFTLPGAPGAGAVYSPSCVAHELWHGQRLRAALQRLRLRGV